MVGYPKSFLLTNNGFMCDVFWEYNKLSFFLRMVAEDKEESIMAFTRRENKGKKEGRRIKERMK